jgi:hypothetical protein
LTIYLDEYRQSDLEAVEEATMALASEIGYDGFRLIEEQGGSIFKRWKGKVKSGVSSDVVQRALQWQGIESGSN